MESARRIVINTIAQYSRSIINTVLSLYSTRLILAALGVSDFGIYAIIGGVVALLGFITNALVVTTQRYISFNYGERNFAEVKSFFENSFFIHIVFAVLLSLILFLLKDVVIYHWIQIPLNRLGAAKLVFFCTMIMLSITIIIAPFKAVFIAHENIVYISVVEIIDGFLKLFLAIYVSQTDFDRLVSYASLMVVIQLFDLTAFAVYAVSKFEECRFKDKMRNIDFSHICRLVSFAGWTTYGTGIVVLRNQGLALMLNRFFGTVINAAYGIAFQVYGAMSFVSTSILNAMNPQIMKAEGAGDRQRMLNLSMQESKYSSALMMIIAIPVIAEIDSILAFWLKDVPQYSGMFCSFILVSFIFDQLTYGLNTANQATGKIKGYSLLIYTPKLMILPAAWCLLIKGLRPVFVMWVYLFVEIIVSIVRLIYMKYAVSLSIIEYVRNVIRPLCILSMALIIVSCFCTEFLSFPYRFVLTLSVTILVGILTFWKFAISVNEKTFVRNFFLKR